MPTARLTDISVRTLPPGTHYDVTTPAFGIRVGKTKRTWIVMRGKDRRRIRLGHFPDLGVAEARKEAKQILASKTPLGKRITFEKAYETFKAVHIAQKKESTRKGYERCIDVHLLPVLRHKRLDAITAADLTDIFDGLIETPSEMHHTQACARMFFRWAHRPPRRYIPFNPLEGMQLAKPKRRKRVLTDDELATVWLATFQLEGDFGEIVRLLILLGQRRGETAALQDIHYSDNAQLLTLPPEITKNGREHLLPVGPLAAEYLAKRVRLGRRGALLFQAVGSDKPFSGWSKCKKALDKLASIAPWTLHDLRRTFRTGLGRLGVAPHIGERLVNHISAQSEVEQIYDLHKYVEPMREAMKTWEAHIARILQEKHECTLRSAAGSALPPVSYPASCGSPPPS